MFVPFYFFSITKIIYLPDGIDAVVVQTILKIFAACRINVCRDARTRGHFYFIHGEHTHTITMANTVLLEARSYRPFKSSEEYLYAMREDLAEWLNLLYADLRINTDNFMDRLDTGVALCKVSNLFIFISYIVYANIFMYSQCNKIYSK